MSAEIPAVPSVATLTLRSYWEDRARRFAVSENGLAAVCSYGMPRFYNAYIDFLQRRALNRWLRVPRGTLVLDVGCGIGRWSRRLARRGASVVGIDHSSTMVAEARRRTTAEGLQSRCRFVVCDVASLSLGAQFDLITAVTVIQHVTETRALDVILAGLAAHLTPGGRLVLLEVAPSRRNGRCDSAIFVARDTDEYEHAFARAGLHCVDVRGVDPAPFKTWLLPHYRRLPLLVAHSALALSILLALPIDVLLARWTRPSWHKVFVLERSCP